MSLLLLLNASSVSLPRTDNFNRADSTSTLGTPSDGGSAWVVGGGTWGIDTNQGYKVQSSAYPSSAEDVAWLEAGSANVAVEATFPISSNGDGSIAIRISDATHYIYWEHQATSGGGLYTRNGGTFTQILTIAVGANNGDTYKLTVDSANLITAYQNGVAQGSVTSSFNSTATKHGLYFYSNANDRVDNFSIRSGSGAQTVFAVPAANVTWAGPTPSIAQPLPVAVPAANVTWAGRAPEVNPVAAGPANPALDAYGIPVFGTTVLLDAYGIPVFRIGSGATGLDGYGIPVFNLPVAAAGNTVAVPAANINYAGAAPSIKQPHTVAPPAANVTYAGPAPQVVRGMVIRPPAANVTYAGAAPTVKQSHTVAPPAANVTYAGLAPTVVRGAAQTILVPAANVTYAGVAPVVVTGAGRVVQAPAANVTYAGPAPTVVQPRVLAVPKANVTYAGPAPQVVRGMLVKPPAANVTYAGRAPTIVQGGGNLITVPSANVNYGGQPPVILVGGVVLPPAALAELYGGNIFASRRRKKKEEETIAVMVRAVVAEEGKQPVVDLLPKATQHELPDEATIAQLIAKMEAASTRVQNELTRLYQQQEDEEDDMLLGLIL